MSSQESNSLHIVTQYSSNRSSTTSSPSMLPRNIPNNSLGNNINILNMSFTNQLNCPIYDGDGGPFKHCFVCEVLWEANIVVDENRQV